MIQLHPVQLPYLTKLQEFMADDRKCLDINMPTGIGKGVIFNRFIDSNPHLRVLYVAHNIMMKAQADDEFNGLSNVVVTTHFRLLKRYINLNPDDVDVVIIGDFLPGVKYNLVDFKKQKFIRNIW